MCKARDSLDSLDLDFERSWTDDGATDLNIFCMIFYVFLLIVFTKI